MFSSPERRSFFGKVNEMKMLALKGSLQGVLLAFGTCLLGSDWGVLGQSSLTYEHNYSVFSNQIFHLQPFRTGRCHSRGRSPDLGLNHWLWCDGA
jgi:hypothetical protein